jgi:hypothetical protein
MNIFITFARRPPALRASIFVFYLCPSSCVAFPLCLKREHFCFFNLCSCLVLIIIFININQNCLEEAEPEARVKKQKMLPFQARGGSRGFLKKQNFFFNLCPEGALYEGTRGEDLSLQLFFFLTPASCEARAKVKKKNNRRQQGKG